MRVDDMKTDETRERDGIRQERETRCDEMRRETR